LIHLAFEESLLNCTGLCFAPTIKTNELFLLIAPLSYSIWAIKPDLSSIKTRNAYARGFRELVYPKTKMIINYSRSSCSKPVWVSFLYWKQKLFWRIMITRRHPRVATRPLKYGIVPYLWNKKRVPFWINTGRDLSRISDEWSHANHATRILWRRVLFYPWLGNTRCHCWFDWFV